jgi:hypothetical protein
MLQYCAMKLEVQLQTHYNIKAEKSSITADFLVRLKFYHAWHKGMKPEVAEMAESRRSEATELQLNLKR